MADHNEFIKERLAEGKIHMRDVDTLECSICHDEVEEDDHYEAHGEIYCRDCYYDNYDQCEHCGDTIDIEDGDYVSTDNGRLCTDCGKDCDECDNGYPIRGRRPVSFYDVVTEGGEDQTICQNCFDRNYFECEGCDEGHHNDEYRSLNGQALCNKCFDKEWKADTEDTLNKWVEASGDGETIVRSVREQAEKEFKENKLRLVQHMFQKMKDEGYLYSWDDLDLDTALTFIPEEWKKIEYSGNKENLWYLYNLAATNPLEFAMDSLTEDMYDSGPSEEWGSDEVMDWLTDKGVIEDDHYNKDFDWFEKH